MLGQGFVSAAAIAASVLFILSLGGLSNQEKAKRAVWYGIVAPAHTPRAIIERLNSEIVAAVKSNDINDRLIREAVIPGGTTPEAFAAFLKTEMAKWGKVVKDSGAKAE